MVNLCFIRQLLAVLLCCTSVSSARISVEPVTQTCEVNKSVTFECFQESPYDRDVTWTINNITLNESMPGFTVQRGGDRLLVTQCQVKWNGTLIRCAVFQDGHRISSNISRLYVESQATEKATVLLIGSTGNGKSALGNFLLNPFDEELLYVYEKQYFKTSRDAQPHTNETKVIWKSVAYESFHHFKNLTVIDTPGLNNVQDRKNMIYLMKMLQDLEGIHTCILVVKFDGKIDNQYKATLKYYFKLLPDLFKRNIIVVVTHYFQDAASIRRRERLKINEEVIKRDILDAVCTTCGLSADPMLFMIDSLPPQEDNVSLSVRNEILYYAFNQEPIPQFAVAKLPSCSHVLSCPRVLPSVALIKYDKRLQEAMERSRQMYSNNPTLQEELEVMENVIIDLKADRKHWEMKKDEIDTEELVDYESWHTVQDWDFLEPKVSDKYDLKTCPYTTQNVIKKGAGERWKYEQRTPCTLSGKVEAKIKFHGFRASVILQVYKRDKYEKEITDYRNKIEETESRLNEIEMKRMKLIKTRKEKSEQIIEEACQQNKIFLEEYMTVDEANQLTEGYQACFVEPITQTCEVNKSVTFECFLESPYDRDVTWTINNITLNESMPGFTVQRGGGYRQSQLFVTQCQVKWNGTLIRCAVFQNGQRIYSNVGRLYVKSQGVPVLFNWKYVVYIGILLSLLLLIFCCLHDTTKPSIPRQDPTQDRSFKRSMGKTTGVAGGAKEKQAQDDSSNSNIDKEKEHRNEERINETERGSSLQCQGKMATGGDTHKLLTQPVGSEQGTRNGVIPTTATGTGGTILATTNNTPKDESAVKRELTDAIKNGDKITRKLANSMILGPPESGKTSFMNKLLERPQENFLPSTGVSDPVVEVNIDTNNPSSFHAARVTKQNWKEGDYGTSLLQQIYSEGEKNKLISDSLNKNEETTETSAINLSDNDIMKLIDNVIKKGGSIEEFQSDGISLYLRDTGGHLIFQEMLSVLIRGSSLVIFVFRADHDIKEKFTVRYRVSPEQSLNYTTSSISTEEALLQCLASVYAMDISCKAGIQTFEPKVFIVATHKDRLKEPVNDQIAKLNETLDSLIKSNIYFQNLVEYADKGKVMFVVNNFSESDEDFELFKTKLHDYISGRNEFIVKYPIGYLLFSLELQCSQHSVLSLEQCKQIAAKYGIVGDKVSHLLKFLHHRVGVMQYYDFASITMAKPVILFRKVTDLVKMTFFRKSLSSKEERYLEKGILTISVIKNVVKEDEITPEKFLQLLEGLHIITPFTTSDHEKHYFIPCVLTQDPPSDDENHKTDIWPLRVQFKCGHCPKGLFGVLVSHLLTPLPSSTLSFELNLDKIYRDLVYFEVHSHTDQDKMSLRAFLSHLEISFFPSIQEDRDISVQEVCHAVREAVEKAMCRSLKHLGYDTTKVRPITGFQCNDCNEFHEVRKGRDYYRMLCKQRPRSSWIPPSGKHWYNEGTVPHARPTPSPLPWPCENPGSTPECYDLLVRRHDYLANGLETNLSALTSNCYSKFLISAETYKKTMQLNTTDREKVKMVLLNVQQTVKKNTKYFDDFVAVLMDLDCSEGLVASLQMSEQ